MANNLKTTYNTSNPYEITREKYKSSPFFSDKDWVTHSRRGELDTYVNALSMSNSLDFDALNKEYRLDLLDTDQRLAVLSTELNADREKITDIEDHYTNELGNDAIRTVQDTEYNYYKKLLKQQTEAAIQKQTDDLLTERKQSTNFFVKSARNAGFIGSRLLSGATDQLDDILTLFEGTVDGVGNLLQGKRFDDGVRAAAENSDWAIFENVGLQESLLEWEKQNSTWRDVNGNSAGAGKIIGSIAESFGKALPSIAINMVGSAIAGAGTKAAETVGKASTAIYFSGLGSGTFKDAVGDPRMATVPTYKLMLNSTMKTVAEYAVMKGMSAAFGPSNLDKLIYGQTANSAVRATTLNAFKKIGTDFLQEGTEELLQSYSNYVIDRFFTLTDENFASQSDWTLQTMFDSFIIGGLSTVSTNAISLGKSAIQDIKKDDDAPNINVFKSWLHKSNISTFASQYKAVINDKNATEFEKKQAAGQMYVTYRILTDVYGSIGQVRFEAATNLLNEMAKLNKPMGEAAELKAKALVESYTTLKLEQTFKTAAAKKLKEAGITDAEKVIEKGEFTEEIKGQLKNVIEDIFKADDVKKVVLTKDGKQAIKIEDTLFVPIKFAENASANDIFENISEQRLVEVTTNNKKLQLALKTAKDVFQKVTNRTDVDMTEVVYNLYYNPTFQRALLAVANTDMFNLLANLQNTEKAINGKVAADAIYKKKTHDAMLLLSVEIFNYLVNQQEASVDNLTIFNDKQKLEIKNRRYSKDLKNRVLAGKGTDADYQMLDTRVNSLPITAEEKTKLLNGLNASSIRARQSAFAVMELTYKNIFNSQYDGKTYLKNDGIPNVMFNEFIKSMGLTIDTLSKPVEPGKLYDEIKAEQGEVTEKTTIAYYKTRFKQYTNNAYAFVYRGGIVYVRNIGPINSPGGNLSGKERSATWRADKRTVTTIKNGGDALISDVVGKTVDAVTKANITLKDVIFNPDLLLKKMKADIIKEFGTASPLNTFLYLRQYYLNKDGTTSIVVTPNGDYMFADVRPMASMLKVKQPKITDIKASSTAKDFIGANFLTDFLADVKVKVGKDTYYDHTTNTIVIAENSTDVETRFAILHEFQHAIQYENKMNGGLNYNWIKDPSLDKEALQFIVRDLRRHKPELFHGIANDSEMELQIVQDFVYNSTGESQAYGLEGMNDIQNFYPVVVQRDKGSVIVIMPWGTRYKLNSVGQSLVYTDENAWRYEEINELAMEQLILYDPRNVRKGFILPSGDMGFLPDVSIIHNDIFDTVNAETDNYLAAQAFMTDALQITTDSVEVIQFGNKFMKSATFNRDTKGVSYTVRMLPHINSQQRASLHKFIDQALADGHTVTLGDANGMTLVSSNELLDGWKYSDALIKLYGKELAHSKAYGDPAAKTENGLQRTQGSYYEQIDNSFRKLFKHYTKGDKVGFITTDGFVGFGSKDTVTKVSANTKTKQVSRYLASAVTILINNNIDVKMPDYLTSAQAFELTDVLEDIAEQTGLPVKIELPSIEVTYTNNTVYKNYKGVDVVYKSDIREASILAMDTLESLQSNYDKVNIASVDDIQSMAKQPGRVRKAKHIGRKVTIGETGEEIVSYDYGKDNRFVSNAAAKGTNLEHFIRKNRPIRLNKEVQDFVLAVDPALIDPKLWARIGGDKAGTLDLQEVYNFVRSADTMDKYTFDTLNKYIFKNEAIESFQQLKYLTDLGSAEYYALRGVLKELGSDRIYEKLSNEKFAELIKSVLSIEGVKAKIDAIMLRYNTFRGNEIRIDYKAMKLSFLKYFDGTIHSAGGIAAVAKMLAIKGWDTTSAKENIGIINNTKEASTTEDATDLILDKDGITGMAKAVIDFRLRRLEKHIDSLEVKPTMAKIKQKMFDIRTEVEDMSDSDLEQYYAKVQISLLKNKKPTDEELKPEVKIVRPRKNIAANIKRLASTIKNNLSKKDSTKFLKVYGDLFNSDMTLKPETYTGKKREALLELEDSLRLISSDAKSGVFSLKDFEKLKKKLEITQRKLEAEKAKRATAGPKIIEKTVILNDREFILDTTLEMPPELRRILDTTFEKFYKTDVKFLTPDNEQHTQLNLKTFLDQNSERLNNLSEEQVVEIINFYNNSAVRGTTTDPSIIKYNTFKLYVLGYIYDKSRHGMWNLMPEHIINIEQTIKLVASNAGTELAAFRAILDFVNPEKVIKQSMAKKLGIELDDKDINAVVAAVRTNDTKQIAAATKVMMDNALVKYKGTKKSFWDKAWQFQRMAMLSGPGTAVRNVASNSLVTITNRASSALGGYLERMFRGKNQAVKGQYKIGGAKVTDGTKTFIKTQLIDSGLFALIEDGLSKYDIRKANKSTQAEIMAELITNKVASDILNQNAFDNKVLNGMNKVVMKMLSDTPFVKKQTLFYLGHMIQDTNMPLTMNNKMMEVFAEAYTLAAWDYMHKPNVFNDIENKIRERFGVKGFFAYKQILPFAAASWNWFTESLKYNPVALIKAIVDLSHLEKTIGEMEESRRLGNKVPSAKFAHYLVTRDIGKGVIGSIAILIGVLLGLTGAAGVDEEDDKLKLKVGNHYIDITNIFGSSSILMGIAFTNPWKNKDENFFENWQKLTANILNTVADDSIFGDLMNGFRYSDTVGEWLLAKPNDMLNSFIPNFWKATLKLIYNHNVTYSKGVVGSLERFAVNIVPGLAYAFPKRVDPYTGEVQPKYNLPFLYEFINSMTPIKLSAYGASENEKEALGVGVRKAELTGRYEDIGELKAADKVVLNTYYGQLNKKALDKLHNSGTKYKVQMDDGKYKELTYSKMSEEQKKRITDRLMADNAKIAKIYIHTKNGGKYYASESEFKELKSLGLTNILKENDKKKGFI